MAWQYLFLAEPNLLKNPLYDIYSAPDTRENRHAPNRGAKTYYSNFRSDKIVSKRFVSRED